MYLLRRIKAKRLGVNGTDDAFNPSNGVERKMALFSPPIASLHWGLFILKTSGLPLSPARGTTDVVVTVAGASIDIYPLRRIKALIFSRKAFFLSRTQVFSAVVPGKILSG
jgi:hypothetical protein